MSPENKSQQRAGVDTAVLLTVLIGLAASGGAMVVAYFHQIPLETDVCGEALKLPTPTRILPRPDDSHLVQWQGIYHCNKIRILEYGSFPIEARTVAGACPYNSRNGAFKLVDGTCRSFVQSIKPTPTQ